MYGLDLIVEFMMFLLWVKASVIGISIAVVA